MEFHFPIRKIPLRTDLRRKLEYLGFSPTIHRAIIDIILYDTRGNEVLSTQAIFDTGAPFSIIPASFLELFGSIHLISHTIWGIVNKPECHIKADFANITLKIQDARGTKSPYLNVPMAFAHLENLPIILGMKGILDNPAIECKIQREILSLIFHR
ncbi:MAG: hypothetical protein ACTSRS_03420 [Candidatus Helarchaeota archaeon]